MKKITLLVTLAAIVTSAFAFTYKTILPFCVRDAAATACILLPNKMITTGTPNFKMYPLGLNQWDGTEAGCTGASIANCSVDVRLIDN